KLEDKEMSFNFINRGDLYMTFKSSVKWLSLFSGSLLLAACGNEGEESTASAFEDTSDIHVITREDGSGTRGAFVEIAGVVDENEDDNTTATATVQNSTSGVMQAIAGCSFFRIYFIRVPR